MNLAIVLELIGVALLLTGIALFSVAAACITGGIMLLALGVFLDLTASKTTTGTN